MALYKAASKDPKPLSFKQINMWGSWYDKNAKGDEDLFTLFPKFKKENPDSGFELEDLQNELDVHNNKIREQMERQFEETGQKREPRPQEMKTGRTFAKLELDGKDYGYMNRDLRAENSPAPMKNIPPVAKLEEKVPEGISEDDITIEGGYPTWTVGGEVFYGVPELSWRDERVRKVVKRKNKAMEEGGREELKKIDRTL